MLINNNTGNCVSVQHLCGKSIAFVHEGGENSKINKDRSQVFDSYLEEGQTCCFVDNCEDL